MVEINTPHRRFNPLLGEWVLVSPHRTQRPWQGASESAVLPTQPEYDPKCYLCPRNSRANGERNPAYDQIFVFQNDFPALLPDSDKMPLEDDFFRAEPVRGDCRVICFSPRHDLTLSQMPVAEIAVVVDAWADQSRELVQKYEWVQIFENRGAAMGSSNPHPHGQIWSTDYLPNLPHRELTCQRDYLARGGKSLLLDVAEAEVADGSRIVDSNADWISIVPFWASWPFETLLLPRNFQVGQLFELTTSQRVSLASILSDMLRRYDRLFATPFPYSMGWHAAPASATDQNGWQLHAHFLPPLLRSATVRKFMVGFELLAETQRDLTPETAAQLLRESQGAKLTA